MDATRKLEIIEETRAFYKGHPGRLGWKASTESCVYNDQSGDVEICCAVGRFIPTDMAPRSTYNGNVLQLLDSDGANPNHVTPYRSIEEFENPADDQFWVRLQIAHDNAASKFSRAGPRRTDCWDEFDFGLDNLRKEVTEGIY